MARRNRIIVSFILHALPGMLVGAALGAVAGLLVVKMEPARMQATVVLFHTPGSGLSDSGRDFVAATLAQADFLANVAAQHGWDGNPGAQLASELSVVATDASRPITELRLAGNDEANLTATLNAIANQMVSLHREKQLTTLQWQSDELDTALEDITRRQREATRRDEGLLPASSRDAIVGASRLVQERRELELAGRYRLRQGSMLEQRKRQRRLSAIAAQEKRTKLIPGANVDVDPARFENEYALAIIEAERLALTRTQQRLNEEYDFVKPLQIVRRAEITPLIIDRTPVPILALAGGLAGILAGGLIWSIRRSAPGRQSAAALEKVLRIPVVGVVAESLTAYGERESRPLARDGAFHLAVAGIHSLRVALHVLARGSGRDGPVIIAEIGGPRHASHLIANLAVVAARAGERVLVFEDASGEIELSTLLADEDGAAPSIGRDVDGSLAENDTEAHDGRISFLTREIETSRPGESSLPVPVTTIREFDRALIHVGDVARARVLLKGYDGSVGLLVCTSDVRFRTLRKARAKTLHGVVLCGNAVDEAAYAGATPVITD